MIVSTSEKPDSDSPDAGLLNADLLNANLAKPAFNPPAWLFGPVWTVLYIFIAIAGWRVWQRDRTA